MAAGKAAGKCFFERSAGISAGILLERGGNFTGALRENQEMAGGNHHLLCLIQMAGRMGFSPRRAIVRRRVNMATSGIGLNRGGDAEP
ncbi:MAG: hypothetical protein ACRECS_27145 [Sphingomonas sp.]